MRFQLIWLGFLHVLTLPFDFYRLPAAAAPPAESTNRLCMRRRLGKKEKANPWASAAAWVQRRRESVKAAVASQSSDVKGRDVAQLASQLWSDGHEREKEFNKKKERGKRSLEISNTF